MSIIGWGGSALVVVSLLQTRILRLRLLNLVGCMDPKAKNYRAYFVRADEGSCRY